MHRNFILVLTSFLVLVPGVAQGQVQMLGIGDSLGEGVQSDNAFSISQQQGYLNDVATQAGFAFQLPLIKSSALGTVGDVTGRSRISPTTDPQDLAVSGALVGDVLNTVANQTVTREVDLVLAPYYGMSQIQVVEQQTPGYVLCWVGNDDIIDYVLDYSSLNNPTGITPLPLFTSNYQELMSRLKATGAKVAVANIPDLTKIAFLFDNTELTRYTGTDYNLPEGYLTTFQTMILLKLGQLDGSVLQNPAYVLDPARITFIRSQVAAYNNVISQAAAAVGFPLVDAHNILNSIVTNPITIEGVTINLGYNGGAFSLDGVHPSDTGYVLFANAFIKALDSTYAAKIPTVPYSKEIAVFNSDPFVDFNGNGVVPGRPGTGLLETLAPTLGLSGDTNEHGGNAAMNVGRKVDPAVFMRAYFQATGRSPFTPWEKADVLKAVSEMLGTPQH